MSETAWLLLLVVSALALASMTIRGVTRYRGWPLAAYLFAVALAAVLGGLIAHEVDTGHVALGVALGVGAVELGPAVGTAVRKVIRAKADRL